MAKTPKAPDDSTPRAEAGSKGLKRRTVLAGLAASAAASGCERTPRSEPPALRFVGQTPERGHLLRQGKPSGAVGERVKTQVLIVGSGAAGTCAAWRLHESGMEDYLVLELEDAPGGTAASGQSARSKYPLGAHYLPSPHPQFELLRELLRKIGVERGTDAAGRPQYDPSVVCRAPVERHRYKGQWFGGLYPGLGETAEEAEQWERWWDHLRALESERGLDGRRLFDLPVERSSEAKRSLDAMTMDAYLREHGFDSWRLRWTVEYACRDDYGCTLEQTSAFAGLHHYLARGLEESHDRVTLMWPGGNGELVEKVAALAEMAPRRRTGMVVFDIDPVAGVAHAWDVAKQQVVEITAQRILWAAPRFVMRHVVRGDELASDALTYAPWLVANVEVSKRPGGIGIPLAWDNVNVEASHLGYVVSTHGESLVDAKTRSGTVLTYYDAKVETASRTLAEARGALLGASLDGLAAEVFEGLEGMHPGMTENVRSIEFARWGHAMIRPVPGLLFGDGLRVAKDRVGVVQACGTDVGGVPLFEQALCNGVAAAEGIVAVAPQR